MQQIAPKAANLATTGSERHSLFHFVVPGLQRARSMAAYQVLEVTLISAKDLKRVTLFSKMRVYAVASISGGDPRLPTHRTYADREGGRNPMWQAPLRFTIPPVPDPRALALHVLLRAERAFGDRDVGEVFVPVRDLAAPGRGGGGEQRHLSYQVRRPVSGRTRGVLHISYRLTDVPAAEALPYAHEAAKRQRQRQHKSGPTACPAAPGRRPPYQRSAPQYAHPPHHLGHAGAYGRGGASAGAARHDGGGMDAGLGLGLMSGAVGGMGLGEMIADSEAYQDGGGGC
jgi:hypothetical protein